MPDDDGTFELSRRKALAGLGTIGVASAGAGLGTSAFFSDTETFSGNSLTAGELDMLVDWEEHYSDWMGDEEDEASMPASDNPSPGDVDYYLPAPLDNPDSKPIALNFTNSQDAFWNATSIEALPDTDNGGDGDGIQDEFDDAKVCENDTLVDVGANDNGLGSSKRTKNDDTVDENDDPLPLVNLGDVKPGDFGEVTFSFHLCTNPGYVWMQGSPVTAAENGITEPEGKDPQETGGDNSYDVNGGDSVADILDSDIELLDEMRTRMWYDKNCDNQIATGDVDVMIFVDDSISDDVDDQAALTTGLGNFVGGLPDGSYVGLLEFGNGDVTIPSELELQMKSSFTTEFDSYTVPAGSGNTPLPQALDIADQHLRDSSFGQAGAQNVIVAFTDGGPNYENGTYETTVNSTTYSSSGYTGGGGGQDAQGRPGGISDSELIETAEVARDVRGNGTRIVTVNIDVDEDTDPVVDLPAYLRNEIASSQAYAKHVQTDDLAAVANDLVATTMMEDLFFEGSLREALDALSDGHGIPLDADPTTSINEFQGSVPNIDPEDGLDEAQPSPDEDGDPEEEFPDVGATNPDRDCFAGSGTTHCIGFEWWLPVDHANQIQGDSVSFDIGFYTEQCRHNDGSGQPAES
mgnify:CR=1 FL=1